MMVYMYNTTMLMNTMYDGVHVQYHSDEYCDSSSYDDIGWSD